MTISFAEYSDKAGSVKLHIILRDIKSQVLNERLANIKGCEAMEAIGDDMLALRAGSSVNVDEFLGQVAKLAADFNAEIIESRLCASGRKDSSSIVISDTFSVLAPDDVVEQRPGHHAIYLEPGISFGSGSHPSTRLAVRSLEEIATFGKFPQNVLDIGCGSAILAIICAKLGAKQVLGIDINPVALLVAGRNVRLNNEEEKIIISDTPLVDINQKFDLIVANISPFVLLDMIPDLARLLASNAQIVLAGMRKAQLSDLRCSLAKAGLAGNEKNFTEGQWVGMLME